MFTGKSRNNKYLLIIPVALYIITRIYKLGDYPIFTDESMYINWGRLIWVNPVKYLFFSLTDGQQPFFIWLSSIAWKAGGPGYLVAGRFISVLSGLGTLLLLYLISKKLFDRIAGLIASMIYVISPFAVWYDRLAIKDSFLFSLACLIFYLTLHKPTMKLSLSTGFILGIALLTKSIAYFFVLLTVLNLVLFHLPVRSMRIKELFTNPFIKKIGMHGFIILTVAIGMSQIMRLSEAYALISKKNQYFLLTPDEFIHSPFQLMANNLYQMREWVLLYISLPILLVSLAGAAVMLKRYLRPAAALFFWMVVPLLFELVMAKVFFPRYILIILLPISVSAAYFIRAISSKFNHAGAKIVLLLAFTAIFIPNSIKVYQLINDPVSAPMSQIDRWQYIEGWPSGYGLKDAASLIRNRNASNGHKVRILTEDVTLTPAGFALEFADQPGVMIDTIIPNISDHFPELEPKAEEVTLVVISNRTEVPLSWPLYHVKTFERPGGASSIRVYELKGEL